MWGFHCYKQIVWRRHVFPRQEEERCIAAGEITLRQVVPYSVRVQDIAVQLHEPQMGLDTKTYWLTDRQSQSDLDLDVEEDSREIAAEV
jgi:hypothetical protein